MLDSDIIYIIMRTFPESIVLILAGVTLLGIKKDKFYILKQGIILGIIISMIRKLPISFGIHTVLGMIVLGIMLSNMSKESIIKPIIATCKIWISLAMSEVIYMIIATKFFKMDFETLAGNIGLKASIITLPSLVIFFIIILFFVKIEEKLKIKDYNINK